MPSCYWIFSTYDRTSHPKKYLKIEWTISVLLWLNIEQKIHLISQSQLYVCPCCNLPAYKQRQSHTSAWSHITWYQTPAEYFFYSPFPITTVPLILCYSRFIVNTVTGVFIKDSSGPWSVLWCYTELFVNWTTVRVPICTFTVSPSGCSEAERGGGNKIRKDEAKWQSLWV